MGCGCGSQCLYDQIQGLAVLFLCVRVTLNTQTPVCVGNCIKVCNAVISAFHKEEKEGLGL